VYLAPRAEVLSGVATAEADSADGCAARKAANCCIGVEGFDKIAADREATAPDGDTITEIPFSSGSAVVCPSGLTSPSVCLCSVWLPVLVVVAKGLPCELALPSSLRRLTSLSNSFWPPCCSTYTSNSSAAFLSDVRAVCRNCWNGTSSGSTLSTSGRFFERNTAALSGVNAYGG
jgi:hypothetical protein